jgi:hypothetical protein
MACDEAHLLGESIWVHTQRVWIVLEVCDAVIAEDDGAIAGPHQDDAFRTRAHASTAKSGSKKARSESVSSSVANPIRNAVAVNRLP